jgi:peptidoglycan hydrolase CwlO-like protein
VAYFDTSQPEQPHREIVNSQQSTVRFSEYLRPAELRMELPKLIDKLRDERTKLDNVIAALEQLEATMAEAKKLVRKKRGRKSMDEAGRKEVSERMKKYWASRRSRQRPAGS